jgi:hypothetical protein
MAVFRVIDALDAPHGGSILRLRLLEGDPPSIKDIKGSTLTGRAPDGSTADVRVTGFAVFGGKASDERFKSTGRIDVHVEDPATRGATTPVTRTWTVEGP